MKLRNFVIILFLSLGSAPSFCGTPPPAAPSNNPLMPIDQVGQIAQWIAAQPYLYAIGLTLGGLYVVSRIQRDNPDFFSSIARAIEWPFFVTQRKFQRIFCSGKSLTWNEVASWHNRVFKLLSPLTKATSVVDLGKDRRLRAMDAQDDQTLIDQVWAKQVVHIERELGFLVKVLRERLCYYEDQASEKNKKKKSEGLIKLAGKSIMRTSLNRNEEIAFGLKEVEAYLTETVEYCSSITQASALDKEHLKKLVGALCATFEHLGTLVDEVSAADRTKKKIAMVSDVTRGYAGIGGGGYAGDYGTSQFGYGGG